MFQITIGIQYIMIGIVNIVHYIFPFPGPIPSHIPGPIPGLLLGESGKAVHKEAQWGWGARPPAQGLGGRPRYVYT